MGYITGIFGNVKNFFIFLATSVIALYMIILRTKADNSKDELNDYKSKIQDDTIKNIKKSHEEELEAKEIEANSKDSIVKDLKNIDDTIDKEMEYIENEFDTSIGSRVEFKIWNI